MYKVGKAIVAVVVALGMLTGISPYASSDPVVPRSTPPHFFAYRLKADGSIAAFRVDTNGDLNPLPFLTDKVTGGSANASVLLRHPKRPIVYRLTPATLQRTDVTVYAVGPEGKLTHVQELDTLRSERTVISPDGKWFCVGTGVDSGKIRGCQQIYRIAPNGTLTFALTTSGGPMNGNNDGVYSFVLSNNEMVLEPTGKFAFLSSVWEDFDRNGAVITRYRIGTDGSFKEDGPTIEKIPSEDAKQVDNHIPGWLTFSGDGKTALMTTPHAKDVYVARVDAKGRLSPGRAVIAGLKPTAFWATGTVGGFDSTGRFVLLTYGSLGPPDYKMPIRAFRIGRILGPGKVQEVTRFGDFKSLKDSHATPTFSEGAMRPDGFIDAILGVKSGAAASRYHAIYKLKPDGTVIQVKPWTQRSDTDEDGKAITRSWASDNKDPISRTVFVQYL